MVWLRQLPSGLSEIGACFSGLDAQDDQALLILKDEDLLEAPDDSAFLQSLRFSCSSERSISATGPGRGLYD